MYSTDLIIKIYVLMNLLFMLLLLTHDYTYYLFFVELIALYFGVGTIRCMINGNCYNKVIWIFIFYFLVHLITFFLLKQYFPKTMKKLKIIHAILKKLLSSIKSDIKINNKEEK